MSMHRIVSVVFFFLLLVPSVVPGSATKTEEPNLQAHPSHCLVRSVIGSAGFPGTSTNYKTNGTMGQPTPIGIGSSSGNTLRAGFWSRYWIPTDVEETPAVFSDMLFQNFPNPFNPSTTIRYSVSTKRHIEITIYNVNGQRIRRLVNEDKAPGIYKAAWDGRNARGSMVSTGIYFYRLAAGSYVSVKKMLLLR